MARGTAPRRRSDSIAGWHRFTTFEAHCGDDRCRDPMRHAGVSNSVSRACLVNPSVSGSVMSARIFRPLVLLALPAALLSNFAFADCVSLSALDAAYSQDFNTLASTGTSSTVPVGWAFVEAGGNTTYTAGTGSSTAGDTYSFGATASSERAFGSLASNSLQSTIGACFTNNTGGTITSLDIAYTGEEWRLGVINRADSLTFGYSTDATDLTTGTWTAVAALNFSTPDQVTVGAKDGNSAADRTAISNTISGLSITSGATVWIRWVDPNISGSDDGLAVDDFSLNPHGTAGGGSTPPGGSGAATPSSVPADGSTATLLTVMPTPGSNPTSVSYTVAGDLSAIGRSATQTFYDDGSNGDATAGDGTFSFSTTVANATSPGAKSLPVTITDDQSRAGNTSISLTVTAVPISAKIGAIQGTGDASPYAGQTVTTTGNVVTVVSGNNFYMQDPNGDGNPDTSDAIYVYRGSTSSPMVAVGDIVDVTGPIAEFNGTTEFSGSPQTVTVTNTGGSVTPVALNSSMPSPNPSVPVCVGSLPAGNVAEGNWECLESMLVSFDGVVVGATGGGFAADGTHAGSPGSFYATVGGIARPFREPGVIYPGIGGTIPVWDGDPEIMEIYLGKGYNGTSLAAYNAGQTFAAQAVVGDFSGGYELYPTVFTPGSTPTTVQPVADSAAGTLTIASQNMLHFYNDVDDAGSGDNCSTWGSTDVCPDSTQFGIRLKKSSLQVRNVLKAPAVVGVQEVENLAALQSLADQIHTDDTSLTYTPYLDEGNDIGGIDVGFLVRSDVTVNAVTQIGQLTQTDDGCGGSPPPAMCTLNDRPPLLLDASFAGQRFAVLVIHNRSLGSVDTTRVQRKRLEQAQYVAAIVQAWQTGTGNDVALTAPDAHVILGASGETVPAADGSVPLVVVGDYNAYEFTDGYADVTGQIKGTAVQADNLTWEMPLTNPTMCDAGLTTDPATRYSFMFDGYVQELDHALLTRTAWKNFVVLHNAHGNADTSEAGAEVTDDTTPARSADHDGQVLTLAVDRLFADGFEGDTCN
jgi:predicted extracellular nuclease